jgi:hypothetical protein
MNNGKLYIKGTCAVCRGKVLGCYCCDSDGLTFIEAADTVITEWLLNLEKERRNNILLLVNNHEDK